MTEEKIYRVPRVRTGREAIEARRGGGDRPSPHGVEGESSDFVIIIIILFFYIDCLNLRCARFGSGESGDDFWVVICFACGGSRTWESGIKGRRAGPSVHVALAFLEQPGTDSR